MANPLRHYVQRKFAMKQDPLKAVPGLLGNFDGVVQVPNRPNYVFVRINNGTAVQQVYNTLVQPLPDLPVMIGFDPRQPNTLQVIQKRPYDRYGDKIGTGLPLHHTTHEWMADPPGGSDVVYPDLRQLMPLRISPAGGLSVQVYRGTVWTGGSFAHVDTATLDLSTLTPLDGNHCLVLVTVSNTGGLVTTKMAEVTKDTLLSMPGVGDIPVSTAQVLGAVRLYSGQTDIQEARTGTDILDLRWPMYSPLPTSGSTGGAGIILYHTGGVVAEIFDANSTGLTAALNKAASGEAVQLFAISIAGNFTVPAGASLLGLGVEATRIAGTITMSNASELCDLELIPLDNNASPVNGVVGPASGEAHVRRVNIAPTNNGAGGVNAAIVSSSGDLYCHACLLDGRAATGGGSGYAGFHTPGATGTLYVLDGGMALGSDPANPFNE